MKKAMILAAVALSAVASQANATAVCANNATGGSVAVASAATGFVKVPFTAKCSANVFSNYSETGTSFGVVAGSSKGKNYFGGGTAGGGVRPLGTCATSGCSATEVSDTNSTTMANAS